MREWAEQTLAAFTLPLEAEEHLLGRGLRESLVRELGIVEWDPHATDGAAPSDPWFHDPKKGVGPRGERLRGNLCIPIRNPRGKLLGFEVRVWRGPKRVSQFLLPDALWNPVFIGLTPASMQRLWDGGDAYIVEGLFDLGAMEQVVPARDVVLATLRARVSPRHVQFLHRFCHGTVNMVYDNDATGRQQTEGWVDEEGKRHWGAVETLKRVGLRVRDLPYRGGKDPGAIWELTGTPGLRKAFGGTL